jgi:hypothetical protein
LLAGCRVRATEKTGIELVVPNPSGAQGYYILPPSGLASICAPTVHDVMLLQYLSDDPAEMTPEHVRGAAHRVAAEGFAGHEAAMAAEQAMARDRSQMMRTHHQLIASLMAQIAPNSRKVVGEPMLAKQIDGHADAILQRLAETLRCTPFLLASGLQAIAEAYAPVGFAHDSARIPTVVQRLEDVASDMSRWLAEDRANDVGGIGQAMAETIRTGQDIGPAIVQEARGQLASPLALLRHWVSDAAAVIAIAHRASWLMDGWDTFCLVWMSADTDLLRRAVLLELPHYLPVLPREAVGWTSVSIPTAAMEPSCRVVSREDGWRSGGAAFSLIERNEKLRVRSV